MKESFLITGATGFVGSHLTQYLLDKGHSVKVLCRNKTLPDELTNLNISIAIGDITKPDTLTSALKGIHSVFHLAGVVGYSAKDEELMEEVNVKGTQNIVEACIKQKVNKLIHFSSVTAVGAGLNKQQVLNEDSNYNLNNIKIGYYESKRKAEFIALQASKDSSLHVTSVNPSTIYGAGDAKKGSRGTQLKVAAGKFPFYTQGGVSIISINDVVKATYQAWLVGKNGERYILSGDNITIKELFSLIAKHAGVAAPTILIPTFLLYILGSLGEALALVNIKGPVNSGNARASTLYNWFDNSKAKRELGLNPIGASQAIKESIDWIRENKLI